MKLNNINEDEYAGLEDNDEFGPDGDIGPCYACNNTVNRYGIGYFVCGDCDNVGHFSCVLQSAQDIKTYDYSRKGLLSSGWYLIEPTSTYRAHNRAICPTCVEIMNEL